MPVVSDSRAVVSAGSAGAVAPSDALAAWCEAVAVGMALTCPCDRCGFGRRALVAPGGVEVEVAWQSGWTDAGYALDVTFRRAAFPYRVVWERRLPLPGASQT